MSFAHRLRSASLALIPALLAAPLAQAQKGSAFLYGTVIDRRTQAPVPGAVIAHVDGKRSVVSDSLGFYRFPDLKAGIARFVVRAQSFPATSFAVALANGERMERDIELDMMATLATDAAAADAAPRDSVPGDSARNANAPPPGGEARGDTSAQKLPEVTVAASPSLGRRYADFERRRAVGRGHFLTRTQIEEMGATTLQDAVRNMRGVTISCAGRSAWDCNIYMARSRGCPPEYWVDERIDNWFGPSVPVRDIEALEVYMGASDVPGEFAGSNAACGVVVIWTKSGPPRRQKAKKPPAS